MTNLLAFDYGASSGRAILGRFDGAHLETREIHRFTNDPVQLPTGFYWDILRLFHELKQGLIQSLQNVDRLDGVGVDTWGVDFGLLNTRGELLRNPYHYRDGRTEGMVEKACAILGRETIYQTTGIAFQKFNSLYQLMAMKEAGDPILEQSRNLLFIPDLLNYFLTGEKCCEATIASTSQLLEIGTGDWAQGMIRRIGLPTVFLTPLVQPGTIIGQLSVNWQSELNMKRLPVIAVASHDTASAVAAVPATGTDYIYLSSGTWSLMGVERMSPVLTEQALHYNYTNEGGINHTVRFLKNIMGLWIYQECIREWRTAGDSVSYDELGRLAEESPAFQSFINPDYPAFFKPGGMTEKIREYCRNTGQPVPQEKAAVVRCILESLALTYRRTVKELETVTGSSLPVIHIVGGGAKNELLNWFTACATGKQVLAGPVEATAIGNLLSQLIALGEVRDLSEARSLVRKSFPIREYEPADTEAWDAAYEKFNSLQCTVDS